jgi:hypothetical protein
VEAIVVFKYDSVAELGVIAVEIDHTRTVDAKSKEVRIMQAGHCSRDWIANKGKFEIRVPVFSINLPGLASDKVLRLSLDIPPVVSAQPPLDRRACRSRNVDKNTVELVVDHSGH